MISPTRRALFLDRDGVINVDCGYAYKQEHIEFIDGIFNLCKKAKALGYLIFIITNQAGIGRGYYSEDDFHALSKWMHDIFDKNGCGIDHIYFCPTHPDHGIGKYKIQSPLRKPEPGMLLQAAKDHNINLNKSILIGDKETDIQAGIAAGIGCNLLFNESKIKKTYISMPTAILGKLSDAEPFLTT